MPKAWRGAALQDGSFMGCQQAAPGNDSAQCFAHRVYSVWRMQPAHRTATPRDVPGSRLLATHRAARLQSGSPPGVRSAQLATCGYVNAPTLSPRWGGPRLTGRRDHIASRRPGCYHIAGPGRRVYSNLIPAAFSGVDTRPS